MHVDILILPDHLQNTLASLDIDEGVRIESGRKKKIFVNRNTAGTFIIQNSCQFHYLDTKEQVANLIEKTFGKKYSAYAY